MVVTPSIALFVLLFVSLNEDVPVSNVGFAELPEGGTQNEPCMVPTLSDVILLFTTLA